MTIDILQDRADAAWQIYTEASTDLISLRRKGGVSARCIRWHEERATRWYNKACELENDIAHAKEEA